jgi:hypothetical protein
LNFTNVSDVTSFTYRKTCLRAVLSDIHFNRPFDLLTVLGLDNAFQMFYGASQQNFSKSWMSGVDACHCSISMSIVRDQAELFQKKINLKRDAVQKRGRKTDSWQNQRAFIINSF